jgi:tryptophan synthase beta chain
LTAPQTPNSFRTGPDERGHFGLFGGRFVAETLMPLILELDAAYTHAKSDPAFAAEMTGYLTHYVGRPSPLYYAERMTEHLREVATASGLPGGAKVYFKRDELNHTGAHKVNNVLGQILLARRMGKQRIIAETGAGQHGVATATLCARFGLQCVVYMGAVDVERQKPNVFRMKMLGAEVVPVQSGSRPQGRHERGASRLGHERRRHVLLHRHGGGPHPYPAMVRDFQCVIGNETREQMMQAEAACPTRSSPRSAAAPTPSACSTPSSTTADRDLRRGAAGHGLSSGLHAASLTGGRPGVLHGNRTYLLQDEDGQIQDAHSISAGLDYPGIGPEHAWLPRHGPRHLSLGHRRRGARRLPALLQARGHHPGPGAGARARQGDRDRAAKAQGSPHGDEPVRAGGQGHLHGGGAPGGVVSPAHGTLMIMSL